jgi:hypothetical protein
MKDLLGLSLEELVEIAEAEGARAELRDQWADTTDDRERLRIVDAAIPLVQRQLELVRARRQTLDEFAGQLDEKLKLLRARKRELR